MAEIRHIFVYFALQFNFYSLRIEYSRKKQKNKPPEIYRILKRFIFKEGMSYLHYDTPPCFVGFKSLKILIGDEIAFRWFVGRLSDAVAFQPAAD